jgi:lipoprotein-anchoring transpeptidase ErfK/SrfK
MGAAVSSGCLCMLNHDILNLYSRVPVGTSVVVLPDMRSSDAGRGP